MVNKMTDSDASSPVASKSTPPYKSKIFVIGIVIATATVIGLSVFLLNRERQPEDAGTAKSERQQVDEAIYGQVEDPDYDAATAALERQLAEASTPAEKIEAYSGLSAVAYGRADFKKVIEYETAVINLDSSESGPRARNIAESYYKLGSKEEALKYYRQALEFYESSPENLSGRTFFINEIKAMIVELEK